MSNQSARLTEAQQVDTGVIVASLRDSGVPWKTIAGLLGMSRVQLWRCLMKQKNGLMKHRDDCQPV